MYHVVLQLDKKASYQLHNSKREGALDKWGTAWCPREVNPSLTFALIVVTISSQVVCCIL